MSKPQENKTNYDQRCIEGGRLCAVRRSLPHVVCRVADKNKKNKKVVIIRDKSVAN